VKIVIDLLYNDISGLPIDQLTAVGAPVPGDLVASGGVTDSQGETCTTVKVEADGNAYCVAPTDDDPADHGEHYCFDGDWVPNSEDCPFGGGRNR